MTQFNTTGSHSHRPKNLHVQTKNLLTLSQNSANNSDKAAEDKSASNSDKPQNGMFSVVSMQPS